MGGPSVRLDSNKIKDNETPMFYVWLEDEPGDYTILLGCDLSARAAAGHAIAELVRLAMEVGKPGGLSAYDVRDALEP